MRETDTITIIYIRGSSIHILFTNNRTCKLCPHVLLPNLGWITSGEEETEIKCGRQLSKGSRVGRNENAEGRMKGEEQGDERSEGEIRKGVLNSVKDVSSKKRSIQPPPIPAPG